MVKLISLVNDLKTIVKEREEKKKENYLKHANIYIEEGSSNRNYHPHLCNSF